MSGRTDRRWRMLSLLAAVAVVAAALGLRLGYWQVLAAPRLEAEARAMMAPRADGPRFRADIVDRNGRILAQTAFRETLVAYPSSLTNLATRERVVGELTAILGWRPARATAIADLLARGARMGTQYAVLQRGLTTEQGATVRSAIAAGSLAAVALEPDAVRIYPNPGGEPGTSLASHLLGFVDAEDRGRYGIEEAYDAVLAGRSGLASLAGIEGAAPDPDAASIPQPIRLTIDATLQLELEEELYATLIADKAKRVSAIVLDPHTGEVLAMASVPAYDANRFAEEANEGLARMRDPVVSDLYEPGSVMKSLTAAAALTAGVVTPRTRVRDASVLSIDGIRIRNADHGTYGTMRFEDVIAYSRNLATAKVALRLGDTTRQSAIRLYRMWRALGIDRRTGIDVAHEATGSVDDPRDRVWPRIDLANRAFGQAVSVTQVQLATAYSAMVNGGFRIRPHVVADGAEPQAVRERVLRPKVAAQMRRILQHVTGAVPWYAEGSLIRGYTVGGKTGTAQIWSSSRREYLPKIFNFSFVGFVGTDDPEVVISVRIHHTRPHIYGQGRLDLDITSYELFKKVALGVIDRLGLLRSRDLAAGRPERLSRAERELAPDRYAQSRRMVDRERRDRGDEGRRETGP